MLESGRHHAHDLNRLSVELNRTSEDVWVAAKASRPKTIGQNDDVVSTWLELFGFENTAVRRGYSKHRKEISGSGDAEQTFRCLPLFDEVTAGKVIGSHLLEDCILAVLIEEVRCRMWPTLRVRRRSEHSHYSVGFRVRQR